MIPVMPTEAQITTRINNDGLAAATQDLNEAMKNLREALLQAIEEDAFRLLAGTKALFIQALELWTKCVVLLIHRH